MVEEQVIASGIGYTFNERVNFSLNLFIQHAKFVLTNGRFVREYMDV